MSTCPQYSLVIKVVCDSYLHISVLFHKSNCEYGNSFITAIYFFVCVVYRKCKLNLKSDAVPSISVNPSLPQKVLSMSAQRRKRRTVLREQQAYIASVYNMLCEYFLSVQLNFGLLQETHVMTKNMLCCHIHTFGYRHNSYWLESELAVWINAKNQHDLH